MKLAQLFCKYKKRLNHRLIYSKCKEYVSRQLPFFWQKYYKAGNWLRNIKLKFGAKFFCLILLSLFIVSLIFVLKFNVVFARYFSSDRRLSDLHTLFVTLGVGLLTVSVVAFSFIMFAMQVNVERMPYGLFRKLSSDVKLLGCFLLVFVLSLLVSFLSIIATKSLAGISIMGMLWSVFLITIFLFVAFKRALRLISPTEQLKLISENTNKELNVWAKAASRLSPFLEEKDKNDGVKKSELDSNCDIKRLRYFSHFPQWTLGVQKAIHYVFLLASYHSSHGDYESSAVAMNTVLSVNARYIKAKGKTFIADNIFINTSLSSDVVVNETLKSCKKYAKQAVARGDEQQISQYFRVIKSLFFLYFSIDYSNVAAEKTHAGLALEYLSSFVESIIPHVLVDVLMSGLHLMGQIALEIISQGYLQYVPKISEKISLISRAFVLNQNVRPVLRTGVEQLAKIEFALLKSIQQDISCEVEKVHSGLSLIAKAVLEVNDNTLLQVHSFTLTCYYSMTTYGVFGDWLTTLSNALLKEKQESETVQRVIFHISQWSKSLCQTEKELLLLAVEKKSTLTFDIIYWVVHITRILLTISAIDKCREDDRKSLIKNARLLIHVLSFIPENGEAVCFVQGFDLTNQLFSLALKAKNQGNFEFALEIKRLLLSWVFKIGKYGNWCWMIQGLCGLVCMNLVFTLDDADLLSEVGAALREKQLGDENRNKIRSELLKKANKITINNFSRNEIDANLRKVDQEKKQKLFLKISDLFE